MQFPQVRLVKEKEILISIEINFHTKMIVLEFTGIYPNQLDDLLSRIPSHWKKVRTRIYWGAELVLVSKEIRQMTEHTLVLTEWKFTPFSGGRRILFAFLFNTFNNSCEVFISMGVGEPQECRLVVRAIEEAFQNLGMKGRIEEF